MSSFWLTLKQQWTIKMSSPLFSIFSLAAILVGSRNHRTHFWKGVIQGPFHQSLVAIGPSVSEEKNKFWNVDGRTTNDRRRTKSDDNSSRGLKARWAKNVPKIVLIIVNIDKDENKSLISNQFSLKNDFPPHCLENYFAGSKN